MSEKEVISRLDIEHKIYILRGRKVMLSMDIASLYQVEPKVLIQAIKRNIDRFPSDFMFQLTKLEFENLKSQFVTSSWGGLRRATPYAFTEQGTAMLSGVLKSKRAIKVNIEIMRVFAKLREMIITHSDLQRKINEMEKKYNQSFKIVFNALRELLETPKIEKSKRRIGIQEENK
ncbi:MAG: hypothetical protein A3B70_06145 [Deltaproteobacteria bacterium RIFCSPHIGHO2_02_FULL_40_11]|nr:MAG: hypothetical protein A3B70_06145 [Deltaproteobacteria bacterium RIFCSPHIGHO2_02_FULL_40_11]